MTKAGPTAYHALAGATRRRSGCTRRRSTAGRSESTVPAATATGTIHGGSRTSIGTKMTWVGTIDPGPTANSTSAAHPYASVNTIASGTSRWGASLMTAA